MNGCFELSALYVERASRISLWIFPSLCQHFRYSKIHLHFCCHSNIVKFYLHFMDLRARDRCQSNADRTLLSNHITIVSIESSDFDAEHSKMFNSISKISWREVEGGWERNLRKGCVNIVQDSASDPSKILSTSDWTVITLNCKLLGTCASHVTWGGLTKRETRIGAFSAASNSLNNLIFKLLFSWGFSKAVNIRRSLALLSPIPWCRFRVSKGRNKYPGVRDFSRRA